MVTRIRIAKFAPDRHTKESLAPPGEVTLVPPSATQIELQRAYDNSFEQRVFAHMMWNLESGVRYEVMRLHDEWTVTPIKDETPPPTPPAPPADLEEVGKVSDTGKKPCCPLDTDGDGNCPVHLAPGVLRRD